MYVSAYPLLLVAVACLLVLMWWVWLSESRSPALVQRLMRVVTVLAISCSGVALFAANVHAFLVAEHVVAPTNTALVYRWPGAVIGVGLASVFFCRGRLRTIALVNGLILFAMWLFYAGISV